MPAASEVVRALAASVPLPARERTRKSERAYWKPIYLGRPLAEARMPAGVMPAATVVPAAVAAIVQPPTEQATTAVAAAQWSLPRPLGRGCSFCPSEGSALLVCSVPRLAERIACVLGIGLPSAEQSGAICIDCMRVIDDAERTAVLRQAMRSHFEANDVSSGENGVRSMPSSAMATVRSGAVSGFSRAAVRTTPPADDQQSQASSYDGCGSSSTSGGGGPGCVVVAGTEQIDSAEPPLPQEQQQAALRSTVKNVRKRYFCSQCEKSFAAKSHYDDHVNKHSAAKKFVCALCGKAFKFKRGLREHARDAHHGGLVADPLYATLDGEDVTYPGDPAASGEAVARSGADGQPCLAVSVKAEPASGGVGDDDGNRYDDESDDRMMSTGRMASAVDRSIASHGGLKESAYRRVPLLQPAAAEGEPRPPSPSAVSLKRRRDSSCTSPEREHGANVDGDHPPGLDDGYCGEEEGDEEEEEEYDDEDDDDDDGMRAGCSSSESSNENASGRTRRLRRQRLHDKQAVAVRSPTVSRILAAALLPSPIVSYQQRQRKKRLSPQQRQQPDSVKLGFDGEAGSVPLTPVAGELASVTFPCELCLSRFKYKRGLVSHVKRKHCDSVEDTVERQRAVLFLLNLKNQRHVAPRKNVGTFGTDSANSSLAAAAASSKLATHASAAVTLEKATTVAVGDSIGSIATSECGDDECDGQSATTAFCQQTSAVGSQLSVIDSSGSTIASDVGDDANGNEESDVFDSRSTGAEAAPAKVASAAAPVALVAGSRDVRSRSIGGRGSPTQPHWVAELRQNAPKFRPLAAAAAGSCSIGLTAVGRQPAGSQDISTEAGRPAINRRSGGHDHNKGADGAAMSSTADSVKSVASGNPLPPPTGKRRRLCEDLSTVRA